MICWHVLTSEFPCETNGLFFDQFCRCKCQKSAAPSAIFWFHKEIIFYGCSQSPKISINWWLKLQTPSPNGSWSFLIGFSTIIPDSPCGWKMLKVHFFPPFLGTRHSEKLTSTQFHSIEIIKFPNTSNCKSICCWDSSCINLSDFVHGQMSKIIKFIKFILKNSQFVVSNWDKHPPVFKASTINS